MVNYSSQDCLNLEPNWPAVTSITLTIEVTPLNVEMRIPTMAWLAPSTLWFLWSFSLIPLDDLDVWIGCVSLTTRLFPHTILLDSLITSWFTSKRWPCDVCLGLTDNHQELIQHLGLLDWSSCIWNQPFDPQIKLRLEAERKFQLAVHRVQNNMDNILDNNRQRGGEPLWR